MPQETKWTPRLLRELKENMAVTDVLDDRAQQALKEAGPENVEYLTEGGYWADEGGNVDAFPDLGTRYHLKSGYDPKKTVKRFPDLRMINVTTDKLHKEDFTRLFDQPEENLEHFSAQGVGEADMTRLLPGKEEIFCWHNTTSKKLYYRAEHDQHTTRFTPTHGYAARATHNKMVNMLRVEAEGVVVRIAHAEFTSTLAQYRAEQDEVVKASLQEEAGEILQKVQPIAHELVTRLLQVQEAHLPVEDVRERSRGIAALLDSAIEECRKGRRRMKKGL